MNSSTEIDSMHRRSSQFWIGFLLLAGTFSIVRAEIPDNTAARTLTVEAIHAVHALDSATANLKFDQAIAADPACSPARLYRSFHHIWGALANRNKADYEEFMKQADQIFEAAEANLDRNDRDTDALFTMGMTYIYRACVYGRFDSYLKAAWDARKGYSYLEDCVEVNPDYHDAYLGLGAIHYLAAMLPRPLRWMFSIIGVESNTRKGIDEIQRAAEKGYFAKTEAQFYLGMYFGYLEEDQRGVDLLRSLTEEFPRNVIFIYNLAGAELRQRKVARARDQFTKVLQYVGTEYAAMAEYSKYRLGECALRVDNFPEAKKWFSLYLQQTVTSHFWAVAYYRIGQCEEAMGNRAGAVAAYEKASTIGNKHQEDRAAVRRALKALQHPLSQVGLTLLKADNLYYSGEFVTVVNLYQQILRRTDLSDDEKGEIYHGLGRTYLEMNRVDEAAKILNRVFGLKHMTETWIEPWTRYYLAVVASKRGDSDLANQYLDLALSADHYDYKMWLTFRIDRLKERL